MQPSARLRATAAALAAAAALTAQAADKPPPPAQDKTTTKPAQQAKPAQQTKPTQQTAPAQQTAPPPKTTTAQQTTPAQKTTPQSPPPTTAAPKDDLPLSKDELFGTGAGAAAAPASKDELFGTDSAPASKDELFGAEPGSISKDSRSASSVTWRGFLQQETAFTTSDPAHWSRAVFRGQIGASGKLGDNAKWKATVRGFVDPLYYGTDFYPDPVKRDERADALIGETYVDTSVKSLDLRIGRQNIVWGEMVGLFFADVVSARDLRSFILPTFDIVRIPQWAARGEYFFKGNSHVELLWIPYSTVDNIGRPGSEFYPLQAPPPAGFQQQFQTPFVPDRGNLANSNYGARFSTLQGGWDLSAFYYRSTDVSATFYRDIVTTPVPTVIWSPRHDRIWQGGGTLSKDLGSAVLKGEAIYTDGRSFNVSTLTSPTGVTQKNTWDWVLGLDFNLPRDTRLNLQGFQRIFLDHDPAMYFKRVESGASVLLNVKLVQKWEAEVLWIQSLDRKEYLGRPRLIWKPQQNLKVAFGVDLFEGPITGLFGRYRDRDRVYVETRYDF